MSDIPPQINLALEKWGPLIEQEIKRVISKEYPVPNFYDAMTYALETGGKRVRPLLCLVVCESLGGDPIKALPFAAAVEMLHNYLLVHDDIEDHDRVRRGKPAVWVKYGLEHGINIGDGMHAKVYEIVLNSRDVGLDGKTVLKLIKVITDTTIFTAEGQTMEINARKKDEITEEEYMEIITKKTGYYLAVSMIGGAIIANVQDEIIHSLVEYGKFVGPLFQIRDDMLDLTKGKGREEIGCDIREGKKSIFVVYVLSKCTKEEKNKLLEILRKGHEETTKADISWCIELFKKYDAFDYARRKIDFLLAQAKGAVSNLPAETCKILSDFAEFMAKREF